MAIPKKLLSRKDEITSDFLKLADQYIDDLLSGRQNSRHFTSYFAEKLFIHPRHLTNTVKLTTGKSPCDFLEEKIMTEAKKLLAETNLQIGEISARFAFDEPTNFTKFFKGMEGVTPAQFRKKLKETLSVS